MRRREGIPKTIPTMAVTRPARGRATQKGSPTFSVKIADAYAPTPHEGAVSQRDLPCKSCEYVEPVGADDVDPYEVHEVQGVGVEHLVERF